MRAVAGIITLCGILPVLPAADGREGPPNIIVVLVDDQGYYDLGSYGAKGLDTPRLDRMAAEGIRFTDYYAAAPICSPSRAGLLTGCYPRRIGLETWVQRADSVLGIHPEERTLAELFRENGYRTACIGKWHLGHAEPFHPLAQGFEYFFGLLHNLDPVETVYFEKEGGVPLMRNTDVVERPADPARLTAAYTDEAIRFIEESRGAPFFLYLPHTMLHLPLGVGETFRGKSARGDYGDAVQELDHHVGRLFDALSRLGLGQNTLVIYASDNGREPGNGPEQPLQGRKLTTWEAGIRVPCLAWGPGLGIRRGATETSVVSALDWLPTLAGLSGISVPRDTGIERFPVDAGVTSTRPWNPPGEWASLVSEEEFREAFFIHGAEGALSAVRWRKWKLFLSPGLTLFDLEADPGESTPVRDASLSRKMRGMAVIFQEEMARHGRRPGVSESGE